MLVSPGRIICEIGMMEYPSAMSASMIPASASGVCSAALWNSTMLPGCTRVSTREVISSLLSPFQSSESTSHWMTCMPRPLMVLTTVSLYSP